MGEQLIKGGKVTKLEKIRLLIKQENQDLRTFFKMKWG